MMKYLWVIAQKLLEVIFLKFRKMLLKILKLIMGWMWMTQILI
nr:MAG TPA: hypothetical protein [Bacteriophage sp.]